MDFVVLFFRKRLQVSKKSYNFASNYVFNIV